MTDTKGDSLLMPEPLGGTGTGVAICSLSRSTLRMMGETDVCAFCQRPVSSHDEYGASLQAEGSVYAPTSGPAPGSPGYGAPPPPQQMYGGGGASTSVNMGGATSSMSGGGGTSAQDAYTPGELFSVVFGWTMSLLFWFHLFILIPVCEPQKRYLSNGQGLCGGYYAYYRAPVGGYSWETPGIKYHWYFWLVFGIIYLIYAIQALAAPTRRYLTNILPGGIEKYVSTLVQQPPTLWWRIQCYHYKTVHYTDSKGRSRTRRERVNTHSAASEFHFTGWRDVSGAVLGQSMAPVKRLRCWKRYLFADAYTKACYDSEFAAFVVANDRDTHKDVSSGLTINGMRDFSLSYTRKPMGFDLMTYFMVTMSGFSILYRHYFFSRTTPVDFYCAKEVSRSPAGVAPPIMQ